MWKCMSLLTPVHLDLNLRLPRLATRGRGEGFRMGIRCFQGLLLPMNPKPEPCNRDWVKMRRRRAVAACRRKFHLPALSNQKVRLDGGYDVFGETPKTARETRAVPISKCMVPAKHHLTPALSPTSRRRGRRSRGLRWVQGFDARNWFRGILTPPLSSIPWRRGSCARNFKDSINEPPHVGCYDHE
jgi:hypothetical protein